MQKEVYNSTVPTGFFRYIFGTHSLLDKELEHEEGTPSCVGGKYNTFWHKRDLGPSEGRNPGPNRSGHWKATTIR